MAEIEKARSANERKAQLDKAVFKSATTVVDENVGE